MTIQESKSKSQKPKKSKPTRRLFKVSGKKAPHNTFKAFESEELERAQKLKTEYGLRHSVIEVLCIWEKYSYNVGGWSDWQDPDKATVEQAFGVKLRKL